jgi:hypothetical protein
MATTSTPTAAHRPSVPPTPEPDGSLKPEIKVYSHSPIFYWWPVWLVGFIMAILTYVDGGRMAHVPPGTQVQGNRLVAPNVDTVLEPPNKRMASTPYLGTWFILTLLVVFVSSNVPLRGLWEWIAVLFLGLAVSVVSLYGLWGHLVDWFNLLHIHINLAGYVFISVWLFAIWAVTVYFFDRRTYMIFSAGQVRVRDMIGQAEKVYDVTNLALQLQPNILFRHRVLGLWGAGDLVVRTSGAHPEVFEWPNVLFVRSRLRQIEGMLKAREVVS